MRVDDVIAVFQSLTRHRVLVQEEEVVSFRAFLDQLDGADGQEDSRIALPHNQAHEPDYELMRARISGAAAKLQRLAPEKQATVLRLVGEIFGPPPQTLAQRMQRGGQFVTLNPGKMRELVFDLKADIEQTQTTLPLQALGVDATTPMGRKFLEYAVLYQREGLDSLTRALGRLLRADRIELSQFLGESLPIRPRLTYDQHFARRFLLNLALHGGHAYQYLNETDERTKWRWQQDSQQGEIQDRSWSQDLVNWGLDLLGVNKSYLELLKESGLWEQLAPHWAKLNRGDPGKPRDFFCEPETLALMIEGVLRVGRTMGKVHLTEPGATSDTQGLLFKDSQDRLTHLSVDTSSGYRLTREGRLWLGDALTAVHQILPPIFALREAKTSALFGPQLQEGIGLIKPLILNIGRSGALEIDATMSSVFHEMGHYVHKMMISRQCGGTLRPTNQRDCGDDGRSRLRWTWSGPQADISFRWSPRWQEQLEALYQQGLKADACLMVSDYLYDDSIPGAGHPEDNIDEFAASSFMLFVWSADALVKNIQNPATPTAVSDYAIATWRFWRDVIFHGTVFTKNGHDPFA